MKKYKQTAHLFTLLIYLVSLQGFCQSKKEQISILSNRVDSLMKVLSSERDCNKQIVLELNTAISALRETNSLLNQRVVSLENQISSLNIKIGTQIWTTKNLDVSTYRNGDPIPQVQDVGSWSKLTTGAWCYYENKTTNGTIYGKLYNWYAVNDPRGLAPKGFHIPSSAEWTILIDYLGGVDVGGVDKRDIVQYYTNKINIVENKMKSASGWDNDTWGGDSYCPNCVSWNEEYRKKVPCHTCKDTRIVARPSVTYSRNGTNSSGFSGLPGGFRNSDGTFYDIGGHSYWWMSTQDATFNFFFEWHFGINYSSDFFLDHRRKFKQYGSSVRCLSD
jgi:uncharacterized protein (TIGR02145 family)